MHTRFSSNVVLTKVRAMFGKSLKSDDYTNLLNCNTVSEIAAYLKSRTDYKSVLENISEADIHRGQLEKLLRNKMYNDLAIICRYGISSEESFSEFIIRRAETKQIIKGLVCLSTNKNNIEFYVPPYFNNRTRLNFELMSRAKNYDDFLESLNETHYKKLLSNLSLRQDDTVDLSQAEKILYDDLYDNLFSKLEKAKDKSTREIKNIFTTYIDLNNFVRIVRAKRNLCPGTFVVLEHGSLKKQYIDDMLKSNSEKDVFEIMESTVLGRKIRNINYKYIDQIPLKAVHHKCKNDLHMSLNASVVLFSYMFLMEIELNDIIKIIEGIRYNLSKEEIKALLIVK